MSWTRRQVNALLATAAGCALLPACGSTAPSLSPSNGVVTLSFAQFPTLSAAGGSAVVDVMGLFPIIVVRTGSNAAVALSATCTHQACIVGYQSSGSEIHCACHDANFSLEGKVLSGPAPTPLPVYAATVGASAITVAVS
jgi:cytochrome b6-f complex iron-sulfur subunit